MISTDLPSSAALTSTRFSLTSGVSITGLRMSPTSPPVQHTSTQCTPPAWHEATVAAPLEASSSGCAWMVMSLSSGSARFPMGGHGSADDHLRCTISRVP
ncbi:MAG: hypothetical protein MAG471_01819 [Acidimicrobiaceae bacterium]|nr:hypothetical protein [Acidimicrobiaceae bacterium]